MGEYGTVYTDLKQRMKDAGVTYRDVCKALNRSYHSVYCYLNGLFKLTDEKKAVIEQLIYNKKAGIK